MIYYATSAANNLDETTQRRVATATTSREIQSPRWTKVELDLTRDARSIGDDDLPFIRDMAECCLARAGQDDIVMLVNADICFVQDATPRIEDACRANGAGYAHRYDFMRIETILKYPHEVQCGVWHCGSDMFCFTPQWWKDNNHNIPDMVLGREAWDMVFRRTIKESGGTVIPDLIYHEMHQPKWESERESLAGNLHNRNLASEWLAVHGGDYYDWRDQ